MEEIRITVAEAARRFTECLEKLRRQNVIFVLMKDGKPIARLMPNPEKICYGRDLAKALERLKLPADEAKMWRRDLKAGRKILKTPRLRW